MGQKISLFNILIKYQLIPIAYQLANFLNNF